MKKFILPSRLLGCGINHNGEIDCDRQVSNVQTPLWTASSRGSLREGVHDVDGPSARSPSRLWINVQPRRFVAAKVAASSPTHVSIEKLHNGLRADGARIGDGASNQSGRRMLHGGFSTYCRSVSTQQWEPAQNSSGTRLTPCSTNAFTIFAGTDSSPSLPHSPQNQKGVLRWLVWGLGEHLSVPIVPRRGKCSAEMCFHSTSRRVFASAPAQRGTGGRCGVGA
ncbi:hypothetical protein CSPX01_09744 [Colletotrichum filicis]|nr:hypothetical protein CSPX01_09744 [Colletotrichum filicis]